MMKWIKIRKKPIKVRARQFDGNPDDPDVIKTAIFNGGHVKQAFVMETPNGPVNIKPGDWIVEGVAGEKYPIAHEILLKTYDFVKEDK